MKDWVGQAGMLSGVGLASGANFLNHLRQAIIILDTSNVDAMATRDR